MENKTMEPKKLSQIFEENKETLHEELQNLQMPQDVQKLQEVITSFFDQQLSSSGEYGQSLRQSEMHLLNSSIRIWQTQLKLQNMLLNGNSQNSLQMVSASRQANGKKKRGRKVDSKAAMAGTAIGGSLGAFFNPFTTIAGALAGLCVVIYLVDKLFDANEAEAAVPDGGNDAPRLAERRVIDAELILRVMREMCENIDGIILTFNVQVKNLMPKVVEGLENQYPDILEAFQKFAGGMNEYKDNTAFSVVIDKFLPVEDALVQHGILIQHYSEADHAYFEVREHEKVTGVKEVLPALVKDNILVKKGRVFISKKEQA